jgi:hypothetical protein
MRLKSYLAQQTLNVKLTGEDDGLIFEKLLKVKLITFIMLLLLTTAKVCLHLF